MNEKNIIIMNFTGVYEDEDFYKNINTAKWIDLKKIDGTYGYCDKRAEKSIKLKIKPYSPYGIHFIDSGNFHYVSKFWIDKIDKPFSLCVFDHHSDMQPSLFKNLLSCGDWIKEALDENKNLDKVFLIGTDKNLVNSIDKKYKDRIRVFTKEDLCSKDGWITFLHTQSNNPLYISVDKDVLKASLVKTDWDQGELTMKELESLLLIIMDKEKIAGIDICGEYIPHSWSYENMKRVKTNNKCNQELLKLISSKIYC